MTNFEGEVLKSVKIDLGRNFKTNTLSLSEDKKLAIVSLYQSDGDVPHLILFKIETNDIMIKDCINFKNLLPAQETNQNIDQNGPRNSRLFKAVTISNSILNIPIITAILRDKPKSIYTFAVSNYQLVNLGRQEADYVKIQDCRSNWNSKVFAVGTNDRLTIVDYEIDPAVIEEHALRYRPELDEMQSDLTSKFRQL